MYSIYAIVVAAITISRVQRIYNDKTSLRIKSTPSDASFGTGSDSALEQPGFIFEGGRDWKLGICQPQ